MGVKQRVALWDNAKFFLILLVVIGHVTGIYCKTSDLYKSIFLFIYSFHMPLFIFISGVFYRSKNIAEKIAGYLAVFFVLKVAMYITTVCCGGEVEFSILNAISLEWFMLVLAACTLVTYAFRELDPRKLLAVAIFAGLFISYDKQIGDLLALRRFIVFYPFYLMGHMSSRVKIENLVKKPLVKIAGFLVIVIWAVLCVRYIDVLFPMKLLFTGRNAYWDSIYSIGILYRAGAYIITLITGTAFLACIPTRRMGFVTTFGSRSLQIYFWHRMIVEVLGATGLFMAYFNTNNYMRLLWAAIAIPLTLILALKPLQYPTKWLMKW